MSKTLAQVAQLLSASNEQLFDRYVNVALCKFRPVSGIPYSKDDFVIRMPKSGLKPSITVSGQFQVSTTANAVNVTIINMNANIDTRAYNWLEVEVGYMNSGIKATFIGQITNCYMAKPNPNGELVITATYANIVDLYSVGPFEVEFIDDVVKTPELVNTCANAIKRKYPDLGEDIIPSDITASMALEWRKQEFAVGKAVRHFRSPMECITWLNSIFASYTYPTGYDSGPGGAPVPPDTTKKKLCPLRLGFNTEGRLQCTSSYSESTPFNIKSISAIGSAVLDSTASATITAPFNPGIMPGEVIFVNPKYFKTRVNIDATRNDYNNLGNLWYIIMLTFTFSTQTTNTMTLKLVNTNNKIAAQEG